MAIVPANGIPNQIGPSTSGPRPYVQGQNFGQLIGDVSFWNPECPIPTIQNFINDAARAFFDRRNWYGLCVKGQIVTPPYVSSGTISVTTGSQLVQGIGTNWLPSIIGSSLRVGYNNPIYNIINLDVAAQIITLELPWGATSFSSVGYYIVKYYYSFPNIKYILAAVNLQLQQRMIVGFNQASLDAIDPSRQQIMYTYAIAGMPPDVYGNYQVELYPASMIQQAIPYIAYTQPPNLVDDDDTLPPYVRGDIIKSHATANALRFRPKANPNYSESIALTIADTKMKEYEMEALRLEGADENLYRQDIAHYWESFPQYQAGGAFWDAMHATSAYGGDSDGLGW